MCEFDNCVGQKSVFYLELQQEVKSDDPLRDFMMLVAEIMVTEDFGETSASPSQE